MICRKIAVFGAGILILFGTPVLADETIDQRLDRYAATVWDMTISDETIEPIVQQVAAMLHPRFPGRESLVDDAIRDVFLDAFNELRPEMLDFINDFMRSRLSDADLVTMLDFYESPVGERILEITPELMTQMMGQLPQIQARMATFAQERLPIELAERGLVVR